MREFKDKPLQKGERFSERVRKIAALYRQLLRGKEREQLRKELMKELGLPEVKAAKPAPKSEKLVRPAKPVTRRVKTVRRTRPIAGVAKRVSYKEIFE
jgi:two-component sensor histidine kinase